MKTHWRLDARKTKSLQIVDCRLPINNSKVFILGHRKTNTLPMLMTKSLPMSIVDCRLTTVKFSFSVRHRKIGVSAGKTKTLSIVDCRLPIEQPERQNHC
jgi:hypothetical protein